MLISNRAFLFYGVFFLFFVFSPPTLYQLENHDRTERTCVLLGWNRPMAFESLTRCDEDWLAGSIKWRLCVALVVARDATWQETKICDSLVCFVLGWNADNILRVQFELLFCNKGHISYQSFRLFHRPMARLLVTTCWFARWWVPKTPGKKSATRHGFKKCLHFPPFWTVQIAQTKSKQVQCMIMFSLKQINAQLLVQTSS